MDILFTKTLILIVATVLIGLDVYLASDHIGGNTYSEVIRTWAYNLPLIPYAYGVLAGHFFILRSAPLLEHPSNYVLLGWSGIVWIIAGLVMRQLGIHCPAWVALVLGAVAGHYLWPQHL